PTEEDSNITLARKTVPYEPEAPASESMGAPGIHSLALRARIGFVRIFVAGVIMTYERPVIIGGSHALTEFYPHHPAGPPLRRRDSSGPPPTPGPRTRVPRRAAADPVARCGGSPHLALGCLPTFARRPSDEAARLEWSRLSPSREPQSSPAPHSW